MEMGWLIVLDVNLLMRTYLNRSRLVWVAIATCLVWIACGVNASAADMLMKAQLVWGSNDPGFAEGKGALEKVDKPVADKLLRVLKWRYYWEEDKILRNNVPIIASTGEVIPVKFNDKIRLEVKPTGKRMLEIKLYAKVDGQEKLIAEKTERLLPKGLIILGGDAGDDDAWMVVLSNFP